MTDDNLRHRETILPSEKAAALKQQYEAIKHQGTRGDGADLGKLSLDKVGERNGMSGKTVQRYIYLNENDIAVAQRLKITATTLEGILTVKGQGRC